MSIAPPIRLAYLTYVDERDGVMVGRPDIGSYALFPAEGAAAVRRLADGDTPSDVAAWFATAYGSELDIDDLMEVLDELGFVLPVGATPAIPPRVRHQRLGGLVFSPLALGLYAVLIAAAIACLVRDPGLRPHAAHFFFSPHLSVIMIVMTAVQIPLILWHEWFHALAGNRLGLPTRLSLGRRYYMLVAETHLDALNSVPRSQRYLPILAGVLADALVMAGAILSAALARWAQWPEWVPVFALSISLTTLLRILWQAYFYLETDLYYVLVTAWGCTDLQATARQQLYLRWRRLVPSRLAPPVEERTEIDLRAARVYAPLLVVGYAVSTFVVLWVGVPAFVNAFGILWQRLTDVGGVSPDRLVDAALFLVLVFAQAGLVLRVALRDRRTPSPSRSSVPEGEPS